MSDYDPTKIEDWVVSSLGFWRRGDVNEDRYCVAFRGTWQEVRDRQRAIVEMETRHGREQRELYERQREELRQFFPGA